MQILKKIISPSFFTVFITVLIVSVLWFLPDFLGLSFAQEASTISILNRIPLFTINAFQAHLIQFFVIIMITLLLMRWSSNWQIIPVRSLFPFMMLLLITSSIQYTQYLNNGTFAVILSLFAFSQLLTMYKNQSQSAAFNMMFLMGIASLFVSEYLFLAVLFLIGIIIFRASSFKTFAAAIAGLLVPAAILFSVLFIIDKTSFIQHFFVFKPAEVFTYDERFIRIDLIYSLFILLVTFASMAFSLRSNFGYKLNVRLNFIILCWSFILSLALLVVYFLHMEQFLLLPLIFASLLVSLLFSTKNSKIANILFLTLVVISIAYRIMWIIAA